VKHVELDAYLYTHAGAADVAKLRPNDVFYECDGNGNCGTPAGYKPGQQWGLDQVQAPQAWAITKGNKRVKVGTRALPFPKICCANPPAGAAGARIVDYRGGSAAQRCRRRA